MLGISGRASGLVTKSLEFWTPLGRPRGVSEFVSVFTVGAVAKSRLFFLV